MQPRVNKKITYKKITQKPQYKFNQFGEAFKQETK